jgi:hypothetical protein
MFDDKAMKEIMSVALTTALGEDTVKRVVTEVFQTVLSTKVNSQGNTTTTAWSGPLDRTLLEYLITDEFRKVAEKAVRELVQAESETIKAQIKSAILSADNTLGDRLVQQLINKLYSEDVHIKVKFDLEEKERDDD